MCTNLKLLFPSIIPGKFGSMWFSSFVRRLKCETLTDYRCQLIAKAKGPLAR